MTLNNLAIFIIYIFLFIQSNNFLLSISDAMLWIDSVVRIRLHYAMYAKTRFTLIHVRVERSIPGYFFKILLTREPDSSSNRASSSDDSRFCTIANTRRKTRFPATTDITCKFYAFYHLESRSCSLLTMIGSNPTISDSFVRIRIENRIALPKFGPLFRSSVSL